MDTHINNDNWVHITTTDEYIYYYNPLTIVIDKQQYVVKVEIKRVYTDKGRDNLLNKLKGHNLDTTKFDNINYSLGIQYINYRDYIYGLTDITEYSKSGEMIYFSTSSNEVMWIEPNSVGEDILNKLIKDYNIQR